MGSTSGEDERRSYRAVTSSTIATLDGGRPPGPRQELPPPATKSGGMDDDRTAVEQSESARHLSSHPYPMLPGGQPVRPWAVRTLGGATAAVFALGVASALLASGSELDRVDRSPLTGAVDGESALGSTEPAEPPAIDGPLVGPFVLPDPTGPVSTGVGTGAADDPPWRGTTATGPTVSSGLRSQAVASPSAASIPRSAAPAPTPTSPTPTVPAGPGPAAPPAPPAPVEESLLTVRIDDDTAVAIGGGCTGVEALGIGIGCEPTASGSVALPVAPLGLAGL